jgi:hypothetical protein
MTNLHKCPVCGGAVLQPSPPFSGPRGLKSEVLSVCCEACDEFCIGEWFLTHKWRAIAAEDKAAIAAYLKATRTKSGCIRDLNANSWKQLANLGKKILAQQAKPPGTTRGKLP